VRAGLNMKLGDMVGALTGSAFISISRAIPAIGGELN
jgi:hypothetical protein